MGDLIPRFRKIRFGSVFLYWKRKWYSHYRKNGLDSIKRFAVGLLSTLAEFSLIDFMLKHPGATIEEVSDEAYIDESLQGSSSVRTFLRSSK